MPRHWAGAFTGLAALIAAGDIGARVWADHLWFASLGYSTVFDVVYGARLALFLVVGAAMAAATGLNALLAFRFRPVHPPGPERAGADSYRVLVDQHRARLLGLLLLLVGGLAGAAAAGDWRTWLLFANRAPFGRTDPQFGLDLSFFVFTYPFIRLVLAFLFAAVLGSLAAAGAVHGLYGGLRWQGRRPRATRAAQAHLYLLMGVFVLLKGIAYWVDRYGIDLSHRGTVSTGASYTDVSAVLPAKTVLAVIAVLCAALFFAGAVRGSATAPGVGFGLLVLSAILLGGVYPLVVQDFVVKPNELAKESRYIGREIAATRQAYGVAGVKAVSYPGVSSESAARLGAQVAALPGARLMDPAVMAQAFQQLQQGKDFYQLPGTLSVDRYPLPGSDTPQDMLVAVRSVSGPPPGQATWVNTHLVYTHGFGFVAARADAAVPPPAGDPSFVEGGIPPHGLLSRVPSVGWYQPRVYFGQQEKSYVIVGGPPGPSGQEFDYPSGSGQRDYTYRGDGGVPVGSFLDRLVYAVKFHQLNIALSGAVNRRSRILYVRQPLARVAKVAPFLTLDGAPYPVVADHRILWVVDGYTTTDLYPYSQRIDMTAATATSQSPGGSVAGEPAGQINYLRNSVKAVVDAYTGAVTLYQWAPDDPLLRAWMKAFPGLIKPRRDIPGYLLAHLRYPRDEFEVQRQILATYHVRSPRAFYGGQDFWSVPADPVGAGLPQAASYLTLTMPGYRRPEFSLSTAFVPRGRSDLAAFMAVDSNPAQPGYGAIRILQLPQDSVVAGPAQVYDAFGSFPAAASELTAFRRGGSRVVLGDLVQLPVGGGLLYIEPVYVSASASSATGAYPCLRRVFVYYGGRPQPVGYAATLSGALAQVFAVPPGQAAGPGAPGGTAGALVRRYLNQAASYYARAQAAFGAGDPAAAGRDLALMKQALDDARRAAQALPTSASPSPSASAAARRG